MTINTYSKQARQARSRMPRLSSAAAYAQMDQLMGRTGTSPAQNDTQRSPESMAFRSSARRSRTSE